MGSGLWLQGFETLTSLKILDVANNRIAALPPLTALSQLQVGVLKSHIHICLAVSRVLAAS